ncbi:MAG: c-type cytochrome, partial [Acidobacteria bacterium]|nr:c-type cytochrome [Acidobacteriota bacterium]
MPDKILFLLLLVLVLLTGCKSEPRVDPQSLTERERDGLIGNVRATLTDDVVLDEQNGQWMEVQQASSTTLYDAAGKRTLQTPFRVMMANGFAITQHELLFDPIAVPTNSNSKKYVEHDNKGNVVERGDQDNGKRIAVELFVKYEFDMRGNWIKRTLLRPVEKSGKKELQPSEISHRQIIYADSVKAEAPVELIPATAKQLKSPIAATEENLAAGKNLFLQRCAACHGENGKAKTEFAAVMPTKPADLTEQPAISLTEGEVFSAASEGIKASGMPGLKGRISDEAIWKIAMYVRQLPLDQARAETIAKASPT